MSGSGWGTLLCRGMALYIVATFLPTWASYFVRTFAAEQSDSLTEAGLPVISIFLMVAILLWLFAPKLGRHLSGKSPNDQAAQEGTNFEQVQRLVYSGIGLFLGVNAAIEAIPLIATLNESFDPTIVGRLAANGLKLGLGIWLMLLPEGIIGLIQRLRSWPRPSTASESDTGE